jgi:uncharacterized protein (TIGR02757 family)
MNRENLRDFLDRKSAEYNQPAFIAADPVCIPHLFTRQQDIEIAGFFAAIFAWGNRTTIINKSRELMALMDNAPYDFCRNYTEADLKPMLGFRHRTFNPTDLLYALHFLRFHFARYEFLEPAFSQWMLPSDSNTENALNGFYRYFFSLPDPPGRTRKHIASPLKKSSCKRLNMYLRWMVRQDNAGVDFGCWKKISPAQLVCPLDVHVARVARRFNLLNRPGSDWQSALELTAHLASFDKKDPVKYDFALFGLGVIEKF